MRTLSKQEVPIIGTLCQHYASEPPTTEWVKQGEEMKRQLKNAMDKQYPGASFSFVISFRSEICGTNECELTVKALETVAIPLGGKGQIQV